MLAFWNGGDPRVARNPKRITMPNGDVRLNAGPDPDDDLYAFVPGARPDRHQSVISRSYANDGWTITETNTLSDIAAARVRQLRKSEVRNKATQVMDGGLIFSISGLALASDRESINEILLILQWAEQGNTIPSGVNFTTLDGKTVPAGANSATRLSSIELYAHEMSEHRIITGIRRDEHLAAIDALPDTPASDISDYDFSITSSYAASDARYQASQGWPANPEDI